MIVGNGQIPEDAASIIDAGDLVIRFNDCRSFGWGGTKTDVVAVCNTGRPAAAMLTSEDWMRSRPVRECTQIWSVRDPLKFAELRAGLRTTHPELDDFCDDYTDRFAAFAEGAAKSHRVIDQTVHAAAEAALADHEPAPYVVPSSGMIVIAFMLNGFCGPGDRISIAGFGHDGWNGHPFAAERRLVDAYAAAGLLTRIPDVSILSPSQGA